MLATIGLAVTLIHVALLWWLPETEAAFKSVVYLNPLVGAVYIGSLVLAAITLTASTIFAAFENITE